MTKKEFEGLKESIRKYGLFYPIIVNAQGQILDGRHRYRACLELGKLRPGCTFSFLEIQEYSPEHPEHLTEEKFIYESNIHKRR